MPTLDTTAAMTAGIPDLSRCDTTGEGTRCDYETTTMIPTPYRVRRLTPDECAILQGFPKRHTRIPWRNKPAEECPDGPRYKALGNSMCVAVMRWIGKRIDAEIRSSTPSRTCIREDDAID